MPRTLKCVVIDDERGWLEIVERTLRKSNWPIECVVFSPSLDALDYLHRHGVNLVITDLIMPQLHGFLLIEAAGNTMLRYRSS